MQNLKKIKVYLILTVLFLTSAIYYPKDLFAESKKNLPSELDAYFTAGCPNLGNNLSEKTSSILGLTKKREIYAAFLANGQTRIHIAAICGVTEAIPVLLSEGENINSPDNLGQTPLHLATMYGHIQTIKYLLQHKANVNLLTDPNHFIDGLAPIHFAAIYGNRNIISALVRSGSDINHATSVEKMTPLHLAALFNRVDIIDALLKHGADSKITDARGYTPLQKAVSISNLATIKKLVATGSNINVNIIKGNITYSLLHLAVTSTDTSAEIVQFLIDQGIDVNIRDNHFGTPLHSCITNENVNMAALKVLIKNGADLKATDVSGNTPLHFAKSMGNTEVIKILEMNLIPLNAS